MSKYTLISLKDPNPHAKLYEGDDPREACRHMVDGTVSRNTVLSIKLAIPFSARVVRTPDAPEMVVLESNGFRKEVERQTVHNESGALCVSCPSQGNDVHATSVNITFESTYGKSLTDRSLIWAIPGNPAVAHIYTQQAPRVTVEMFYDILMAAEKAVEEQLLAHFASPAA